MMRPLITRLVHSSMPAHKKASPFVAFNVCHIEGLTGMYRYSGEFCAGKEGV
jgi:hypothetical protein